MTSPLAATRTYYEDKFRAHGPIPNGVDWGHARAQALRFEQLCKLLPQKRASAPPASLNDLGCGYGALLDHLRATGEPVDYLGIDLVPDLVDVYTLLGGIARERCDEEGFVFYEQALRVCHERGLPRKTEAAILHGYGQLHCACGRPEEGRGYLDAARDVYRALGLGPELARVEEDVAKLEPEPV